MEHKTTNGGGEEKKLTKNGEKYPRVVITKEDSKDVYGSDGPGSETSPGGKGTSGKSKCEENGIRNF